MMSLSPSPLTSPALPIEQPNWDPVLGPQRLPYCAAARPASRRATIAVAWMAWIFFVFMAVLRFEGLVDERDCAGTDARPQYIPGGIPEGQRGAAGGAASASSLPAKIRVVACVGPSTCRLSSRASPYSSSASAPPSGPS